MTQVFVVQFLYMKDQVCVMGGATWDVLFTIPQARLVMPKKAHEHFLAFPYGGKVDAEGIVYGFGGGAANVSVGLRRLGVPSAILTRVGYDWRGHEVEKNLRREKVDVKLVQKDSENTTPLSFVVTTGGAHDHVAFVSRGAATALQLPKELSRKFTWVYATALAMPQWRSSMSILFSHLHSHGQHILWNPGTKQLGSGKQLTSLLRYVTILDVNREEAELLAHDSHKAYHGVAGLLKVLKSFGPQAVLVTDGAKGAYYYDGSRVVWQPSYKVTPVNTTGAGDSFGAGFLAGFIESKGDVQRAMHWGMLNASSVIMHAGAQRGLLHMHQIQNFSKRYART